MSYLASTLGLLGILLGAAGCYATAGAYTEADYVDADHEPPEIDVYPHSIYDGRTVYLVNGHWYYRRGPRWVYYRAEPAELYQRRMYYERDHERRVVEHRDRERREAEERHEQERREDERRPAEHRDLERREERHEQERGDEEHRDPEHRDRERRDERPPGAERRERAGDRD